VNLNSNLFLPNAVRRHLFAWQKKSLVKSAEKGGRKYLKENSFSIGSKMLI
jgi:hypothetical protein